MGFSTSPTALDRWNTGAVGSTTNVLFSVVLS